MKEVAIYKDEQFRRAQGSAAEHELLSKCRLFQMGEIFISNEKDDTLTKLTDYWNTVGPKRPCNILKDINRVLDREGYVQITVMDTDTDTENNE